MVLGEKVHDSVQDRHEPLLVGAWGVQGGLTEFVVQMVEFLPSGPDHLRALSGFFEAFLQFVLESSGMDHALPLLLREPERVSFVGFPGRA